MKERPILFSGPMVRAILEGRKTQTRRIVKPQPEIIPEDCLHGRPPQSYWWRCSGAQAMVDIDFMPQACPYGQRRDRLWVRETWALDAYTGDMQFCIKYRADGGSCVTERNESDKWVPVYHRYMDGCGETDDSWIRWRPSIHIPRWASRLTLEVIGVRVERLQDISEDDAIAEGAIFTDYGKRCFHNWQGPGPCPSKHHQQREGWSMVPTGSSDDCLGTARAAFGNLWDSINKARASWESNPWVWVVEFKPI